MNDKGSLLPSTAGATPAPTTMRPVFGTIETWTFLSGVSRRVTYERLASGELEGRKVGDRTLINIEAGLRWIESQPRAQIRRRHPAAAA